MSRQYFFGYGSLVNDRTHAYPEPAAATLRGWRRVWRATALREEAFLSAAPSPGTTILGLVAEVPGQDWAALDMRETGYDRQVVSDAVDHGLGAPAHVQVYTVPDRNHRPDRRTPVLLSYLDVVVQGFFQRYGADGVAHFFATTDGWPDRVRDDRAAPRYPRHQSLSGAERALVDAALAALPVTMEKLE